MAIIEVSNVSMKFRMANDKIESLKETVVAMLRGQLRYEERTVLRNISFDVQKGEVLGILGVNGAGKSTLLKIIAGVLAPTSGAVKVRGKISPMLELGSGFDYELTAQENVLLNGALLGYDEQYVYDRYQAIVDFSLLHEFMDVPLRNFSSGMVARLAFAIATQVKPEILIVDEVLSVGDAAFQDRSSKKMKEMMSGGATVLFVSHALGNVREVCTKALWLEKGGVRMHGDVNAVCEAYEESFGLPKKGEKA